MMKKQIFTAALTSFLLGALCGIYAIIRVNDEDNHLLRQRTGKFSAYFNLCNYWLKLKNTGHSLDEYFIRKGYKEIVIYGAGELGKRLYEELEGSGVRIKNVIDQKNFRKLGNMTAISIHQFKDNPDAIVITPITDYFSIKEKLLQKTECPIISLEDILYQL